MIVSDRTGALANRRVLLTGATSGVGRAVAETLAQNGARLALIARSEERLRELAEALGATAVPGDLTQEDFIESLPAALDKNWSAGPDVLINSAGVFDLAPLAETDLQVLRQHLEVNLVAPFRVIRLFLEGMVNRRAGQIVNIGSIAGRKAFPGNTAYSASKYGLRALHEVLVEELRGSGVKVTWIEPSAVNTPLWDVLDPDSRDDLPSRLDMLRPRAVADAVRFAVEQPNGVSVEEIIIRSNPVPTDNL